MAGNGPRIADLLSSFELSLQERDLSPRTIEAYQRTGAQFTAYLAGQGLPQTTEDVEAAHIRAFLAAETERTSAVSSHQHFRNLRVIFKWLAREGEREAADPMARVDPPRVTRKIKPILAQGQLAALLRDCEGAAFEQRRDMAILRIMIDTGVRVSGVAGIMVRRPGHKPGTENDMNLSSKTIRIVLKGGDEHLIPVGRKAAAANDRYQRARARHKLADSPWLWLGTAGRDLSRFGTAGIQDMLQRRGEAAGIPDLTPHWLRRTFAHDWLDAGGSEMDGMRIAGWKTRAMIELYAGDLAAERARSAHALLSPGDRL